MNLFKSLLVSALLINGLSVNAQNKSSEQITSSNNIQQLQQTPTQKGISRANKLKIDVNLNSTQHEQVKDLFIKVETKIEAVVNGNDVPQDRKQEFIVGNKNDEAKVLKTILTTDQWEIYSNL
ncbi:MAG: hypothetical protein QNL61_07010 [Crocinitomicaceae bacterium]|jgi:hypothetical protein